MARILILHPDRSARKVLERHIRDRHQVQTASDLRGALRSIGRNHPQLVVAGMNGQRTDAFELLRQMQRELSRSRMITAVADADVIVTNPTHYAVALAYRQGEMAAPEVLAKGRGHVALRIREAATAADVPIVENKPLARLLHQTAEVGKQVPENLFQAVAEVLAYVYRIDPQRAKSWGGLS